MEQVSEQAVQAVEIVDSPRPGSGYVAFIVAVFGGALAWLLVLSLQYYPAQPNVAYGLWTASAAALVFGALLADASFRTTYHLHGRELQLKCGVFKRTLALQDVSGINRCGFILVVLGWGWRARGYANRFSGGVRLHTERETVYLSPTNPQLFMEHLRRHRFGGGDRDTADVL